MSLLNKLNALIAGDPPTASTPTAAQAHGVLQPAQIVTSRVLMFVYDPVIDPASGKKLSQYMNWTRAADLANQFCADILEASGGLAKYQIIKRIELNEFPLKADGYRYTAQSYLSVMNRTAAAHTPDGVNYQDFLTRYKIPQLVMGNQIDEIWVFGFPYAGFSESIMGGAGAFFCNASPLPGSAQYAKRFVIMGFSCERGLGEMLESFGHRAEFSLEKVYSHLTAEKNLWKKFVRCDKTSPGESEVGSIHFAPNSEKDYDWGNPRYVLSHCNDWYNFPNFTGVMKPVNKTEWGGEIYAHHKWWLKHLPKTGGQTNGIANNWWQYVLDPNRISI